MGLNFGWSLPVKWSINWIWICYVANLWLFQALLRVFNQVCTRVTSCRESLSNVAVFWYFSQKLSVSVQKRTSSVTHPSDESWRAQQPITGFFEGFRSSYWWIRSQGWVFATFLLLTESVILTSTSTWQVQSWTLLLACRRQTDTTAIAELDNLTPSCRISSRTTKNMSTGPKIIHLAAFILYENWCFLMFETCWGKRIDFQFHIFNLESISIDFFCFAQITVRWFWDELRPLV